jgi:RNA polymerase sigma-70 factor (ECF subfamily)
VEADVAALKEVDPRGPSSDASRTSATLEARLRRGDASALAGLFSAHRDRLLHIVRLGIDRRLAARVDPEDVLQEAFLNARTRLAHFMRRPDGSAFVWLRLVVRQSLMDLHRRHLMARRRGADRDVSLTRHATESALRVGSAPADETTSPDEAALRGERAARVESALAAISRVDQEVLRLRHFEEMSNAEAAEALGLSPTAASNRYVRALRRLREELTASSDMGDL